MNCKVLCSSTKYGTAILLFSIMGFKINKNSFQYLLSPYIKSTYEYL